MVVASGGYLRESLKGGANGEQAPTTVILARGPQGQTTAHTANRNTVKAAVYYLAQKTRAYSMCAMATCSGGRSRDRGRVSVPRVA